MPGTKRPVSVLAVVHDPDRNVLLLERAAHPGYWQSVTGSQEADESLRATAVREVAEETGLDVAPEALGFGTRTKLALARSIYGNQVPDAALNYVWDNRHPIGTLRDNAYTDRARMVVLRSGAEDAGRWVLERRNVAEDFRRAFGDLPAKLSGLALASDTDNTASVARAGFAQFRFVADAGDCDTPQPGAVDGG